MPTNHSSPAAPLTAIADRISDLAGRVATEDVGFALSDINDALNNVEHALARLSKLGASAKCAMEKAGLLAAMAGYEAAAEIFCEKVMRDIGKSPDRDDTHAVAMDRVHSERA